MLFLTCFVSWILSGSLKFIIHSFKDRRFAFDKIGYGGFPSSHLTIATSVTTVSVCQSGFNAPSSVVGMGMTLLFYFDATSLRMQIEIMAGEMKKQNPSVPVKTSVGHTHGEALSGTAFGILIGYAIWSTAQSFHPELLTKF